MAPSGRSRSASTWALALLFALSLGACKGEKAGASEAAGSTPEGMTSFDAPLEPMPECDEPALSPGSGAKVYVDLSSSMAGYVEDNEVAIAAIYRELSAAMTDASALPVSLCPVGKDDEFPCAPSANGDELLGADAFDASSATLALLLENPATIGTTSVVSFITDGTESPLAGGQSLSDGCTPSASNFCFLRGLERMAAAGWTVFVTAIKLPFDGKIYHESDIPSATFERIQEYVAEARTRPEYAGVSLEARRHRRSSYEYVGPRPLLIITLARDAAQGRSAMDAFQARLTRSSFTHEVPEGAVHTLQLNGFERPQLSFDQAFGVRPSVDEGEVRGTLRQVRALEQVEGAGSRVGYSCVQNGAAPLYFRVSGDPTEGPAHLRPSVTVGGWSRVLSPPAVPVPIVELHTASADPADYRTGVNCLNLASGFFPVSFDLRVGRSVEARAPGWWSPGAWSTTAPTMEPDRLFRLADLVTAITATDAREGCVQDRLTIFYEKSAR